MPRTVWRVAFAFSDAGRSDCQQRASFVGDFTYGFLTFECVLNADAPRFVAKVKAAAMMSPPSESQKFVTPFTAARWLTHLINTLCRSHQSLALCLPEFALCRLNL